MTVPNRSRSNSKNSHLEEVFHDYIDEGKKFANDVYVSGLDKIHLEEKDIERYSREFSKTIKTNPIKSVLIAGGIGFLFARLFRK